MYTSMLIAGFGGQGVIVTGMMIGECAFEQGLHTTFLPTYGPEQRGGTANCTIIISDEEIGSPVSSELDVLCAMNQVSLEQFLSRVKSGGMIIINSTLVDKKTVTRNDVRTIAVDADTIAASIGSPKVANIILLATYVAVTGFMPVHAVKSIVLRKLSKKPELLEMNGKAFDQGVEIILKKRQTESEL